MASAGHLKFAAILVVWAGSFSPAAAQEPAPDADVRFVKKWIRQKVVREEDLARFGLKLDDHCQKCLAADEQSQLVVLVHGYNSKAEHNAGFFDNLRKNGLACGTFSYPNDQALADSAKLLSRELNAFHEKHPKRPIALVTHSMGGLVARACIEDPELDPGNVQRLVMIAPPTHGTLLAHFSLGADLCEHFFKWGGGGPIKRMRASIADGLGEAVADLQPQSHFLTTLNARPRNPQVKYSLFLGTGAGVRQNEMDLARKLIRYSGKLPYMSKPVGRFDQMLGDMDEIMAGHGDGVVAVRRGSLRGVSDTIVFPFCHLTVTGPADDPDIAEVHQAVLDRLAPRE